MHILLTDVLTCPRCGPNFGLIVLADRLEERRILEGSLGCANCRETFRVEGGVADLRFPPGADAGVRAGGDGGEGSALRLAALLGARDRPGTVLLLGVPGEVAAEMSRLLPGHRLVAAGLDSDPGAEVDRVRLGERFPFRDRSLRGVVLGAEAAPELLDEAVRVLAPGAHLVADPAPAGTAEGLAARGLTVHLEQEGVVVASSSPAG